jgi:hypothetical protein
MSGQAARRPDIAIRQSGADSAIRVGNGQEEALPLLTAGFRENVNEFIKSIESTRPEEPEPSISTAIGFVLQARKDAYRCFARCVGGDFDSDGDLVGRIREKLTSPRRGGEPPFVEILVVDGEYFPWEWLAEPTPRRVTTRGEESTKGDLLDAMADILGFAAITRRVLVESNARGGSDPAPQQLVTSENKLQVRYVRHLALVGASRQQVYFDRHGAVVDLVGPVPAPTGDFPVPLGTQVLNPAAGGLSEEQLPAGIDQILHFHCHHGTTRLKVDFPYDFWAKSKLVFRDDPPIEVTVDELEEDVLFPGPRRELGPMDRPLVFLNACSGDFQPLSTQSFSKLFTFNRNRGVISTSIRVPDTVAASFASFFYDSLLFDPGTTVGAALHEAKVKLLTRLNNPLGLLYTYVGDPDLVVNPALPSVVQAPMPI